MERVAIEKETVPSQNEDEVLIVVSKLKGYIQKTAGMNTSGSVPAVLSAIVRRAVDQAIEQARSDGRKTVMDRDFTVA